MARLLYLSVFVIQLWAAQGSNLEPPLSSVNSSPTPSLPVSMLLAPFSLAEGQHPEIEAPEPEAETEILSEGGYTGIMLGILFGVFFTAGLSYIYVARKNNVRVNSITAVV
ncbi:hypothetical protein SUGI_1128400 [Cryptomeria japonica]|nr:hypothetical protein SUGI_1127740 [Cryptomeria japonica]GLJ52974.1 hypothetical protein SUGI_1128400 [Cryptomeria japonica]